MNRESSRTRLAGVVPFLLFAVLAVSVLTVLMTGAEQYGNLTDRDQRTFAQRTAGQYVRTKLRQTSGEIAAAEFCGTSAVSIRETVGEFSCVTWIYCHEGWLRELFTLAGEEMPLDAGEKIIEMEALDATLVDGLLHVTLTDGGGNVQTIVCYPEAGEGMS